MKKIKAILKEGGGLVPESPLPKENVKMIVCTGTEYIIFEQGDVLPGEINVDEVNLAAEQNISDELNP